MNWPAHPKGIQTQHFLIGGLYLKSMFCFLFFFFQLFFFSNLLEISFPTFIDNRSAKELWRRDLKQILVSSQTLCFGSPFLNFFHFQQFWQIGILYSDTFHQKNMISTLVPPPCSVYFGNKPWWKINLLPFYFPSKFCILPLSSIYSNTFCNFPGLYNCYLLCDATNSTVHCSI